MKKNKRLLKKIANAEPAPDWCCEYVRNSLESFRQNLLKFNMENQRILKLFRFNGKLFIYSKVSTNIYKIT